LSAPTASQLTTRHKDRVRPSIFPFHFPHSRRTLGTIGGDEGAFRNHIAFRCRRVMSRGFKNQTCIYCLSRPSVRQGDHVFARGFFPVAERDNLPNCQSAAKWDPYRHPIGTLLVSARRRCAEPLRSAAHRRRALSGTDQTLFLKRQLSLPVSMISQ